MLAQISFEKIAPFLTEPLVLIGFVIFLFSSFCRVLIARGVIPKLPPGKGFLILRMILIYGFILGLVIILLGFGLKYREMNKADQKRVISLIEGEVHSNLKTATALALNVQRILADTVSVSDLLRRPAFPLLNSLFPDENRRGATTLAPTLEMARDALAKTRRLRASLPATEADRLAAAAAAIRGTIVRTRAAMANLADAKSQRYDFRFGLWTANEGVLRKVSLYDFSSLQESYARLAPMRSQYDAVVRHAIEYLESIAAFFDPQNHDPQEQTLATVLGCERNFYAIVVLYGEALTNEIEALVRLRAGLEAKVQLVSTLAEFRRFAA